MLLFVLYAYNVKLQARAMGTVLKEEDIGSARVQQEMRAPRPSSNSGSRAPLPPPPGSMIRREKLHMESISTST